MRTDKKRNGDQGNPLHVFGERDNWRRKGRNKDTGEITAKIAPKDDPHPEDALSQRGGRARIKFIVDNQTPANIMCGRKKLNDLPMSVVFRRIIRASSTLIRLKYLPCQDTGDYVVWRKRDFNKQVDHIANVVLDTQKGQFYCDKGAMRQAKARNAFFLTEDTEVVYLALLGLS